MDHYILSRLITGLYPNNYVPLFCGNCRIRTYLHRLNRPPLYAMRAKFPYCILSIILRCTTQSNCSTLMVIVQLGLILRTKRYYKLSGWRDSNSRLLRSRRRVLPLHYTLIKLLTRYFINFIYFIKIIILHKYRRHSSVIRDTMLI